MNRKRTNRLLVLCLLLVTVGCMVWMLLQQQCTPQGHYAEVRVNGQAILQLDMQENVRHWIDGANGIQLCVVCENGSVFVEQSGCPDKICVHKGHIHTVGDTIVCLPARTVVEVKE